MFIEKSNEPDFWAVLEKGMRKNASFEDDLRMGQINEALNYLSNAAASLNLVGLKKEAKMVTVLKDVCEDPHTKGLTSAQMIKNLKEKGIPFNADDNDAFEDEYDPLEVEDSAIL